jgi:hypothetical protein
LRFRKWSNIIGFLSCLGLLSFLVLAAFADDFPGTFQQARTLAEAQEQAAATKGYFAGVLLPYYAEKYGPVLQSCFANVRNPSSQSFAFVVAIGADGRMVRLYNDHQTNVFLCLRSALQRELFPMPPVVPYYLHIEMQFTDEAPSRQSQKKTPPLVLEPHRYSYTFGIPEGWDFSFDQAQDFGARLVFFPRSGSFKESDSVIYINEVCKANCTGMTRRSIDRTIEDSRDDSPALHVATDLPIKLETGGEAPVRILTGARDPRQAKEALAFIEHEDAIVLVVLTTKDPGHWAEDYAAFEEVVAGHRFFTCDSPELAVPCR